MKHKLSNLNKCLIEVKHFISALHRQFWLGAVMCRFFSQILIKMNELKDLIKELRGDNDPSFHNCIIAVTKHNGAYLIKSEPSLDDAFDGCDLSVNLTDNTNVPKEEGVYKCQIRYHCYKSHHPLDPVEWDVDVSIVSCEQVVF